MIVKWSFKFVLCVDILTCFVGTRFHPSEKRQDGRSQCPRRTLIQGGYRSRRREGNPL